MNIKYFISKIFTFCSRICYIFINKTKVIQKFFINIYYKSKNNNSKIYSVSTAVILGKLSKFIKEYDTPDKINEVFDKISKDDCPEHLKRMVYGYQNLLRFVTHSYVVDWDDPNINSLPVKEVFTKEDRAYALKHTQLFISVRDKYKIHDPSGLKFIKFQQAHLEEEAEFLRNLCLHMLETNFNFEEYFAIKKDMFDINTSSAVEVFYIDELILSHIKALQYTFEKIVENIDVSGLDEFSFFKTYKNSASVASELAEDIKLGSKEDISSISDSTSRYHYDSLGFYRQYEKEFCLIKSKWQDIQLEKELMDQINSIKTVRDAMDFVMNNFYYKNNNIHFYPEGMILLRKKYESIIDNDFFSIETFKYIFSNSDQKPFNNDNTLIIIADKFVKKIFFTIYKYSNFFDNFSNVNFTNINTVSYVWPSAIMVLFISYIILSYYYLITSKNAISAIISFFIQIIGFTLIFFYMSNEYIGSIILMVYLGAIIIFFVFILFSSDPKKFSVIYFDTSFIRSINFSFIFIFFIYFSLFYFSLRRLILPYYKNSIIANKDIFNSDKSVTQVIGDIIFNFYSHHVSILGVLLLIALFGSLKMINPKKKKSKFTFKKKSKFTFKKNLTK